jgi:hypothetical protein
MASAHSTDPNCHGCFSLDRPGICRFVLLVLVGIPLRAATCLRPRFAIATIYRRTIMSLRKDRQISQSPKTTFAGQLVCPHCQTAFAVTWRRYWSAPWGNYRCPKCRLTSYATADLWWAPTIIAEDNLLPLLETRVADHILYLGTVNDVDINPTKPIEFIMEVKSLENFNMTGVGSIEAKGIQGKQLTIDLTGVGNMAIEGSANSLDLRLNGIGSYRGDRFKTKQATVHSDGVGSAVLNVSDQLDASVSGMGSIEYIGSPKVQKSGQGMGNIKQRTTEPN